MKFDYKFCCKFPGINRGAKTSAKSNRSRVSRGVSFLPLRKPAAKLWFGWLVSIVSRVRHQGRNVSIERDCEIVSNVPVRSS